MYLEDFRDIVQELKFGLQYRNSYIEDLSNVDPTLMDFTFDNFYISSLRRENNFLISKLLGQELEDEVNWYLYDHHPGFKVEVDGVTYIITDFDSYIDYINNVYKLPMKPKHENV